MARSLSLAVQVASRLPMNVIQCSGRTPATVSSLEYYLMRAGRQTRSAAQQHLAPLFCPERPGHNGPNTKPVRQRFRLVLILCFILARIFFQDILTESASILRRRAEKSRFSTSTVLSDDFGEYSQACGLMSEQLSIDERRIKRVLICGNSPDY